jgi:hypothetical protein
MAYLYADRNVREDTQVDLGALHGLDFALDDFLCGRQLFRSETDTLSLDTKAPVSVRESGAFDGPANGDWNDTLVSLNESYFARRKLVPKAHEILSSMPQHWCLHLQSRGQGSACGSQEGMRWVQGKHVGLCNHIAHTQVAVLASHHPRLPPSTTMSDRKRALEESGPSSASKKARRSVFIAFDRCRVFCPDFVF